MYSGVSKTQSELFSIKFPGMSSASKEDDQFCQIFMHCKCFVEIQVEPSDKVKEFIKYKLNIGEETENDDMVEMRG